jgi:alkanesulfonate monooxygenase SsuD/methylene tetrahydromethanopterin reductase-like flavin-dependent oxidoreductase (luciferase family)
MRYGLDVPTTGEYADARALAHLAAEAEDAGWDGFFLWDVLRGGRVAPQPVIDPWIALAAVALETHRLRIGTLVVPLARHRPWLVARRLANLDQLSSGRVICTIGLGYLSADFTAFGEEADPIARAGRLDEGLEILAGLWSADAYSFAGRHYTLRDACLLPRPVQQPRIPIWVAGGWPQRAPLRRAARWDGLCLKSRRADTHQPLTVDDLRECLPYTLAHRAASGPFDVVMSGETEHDPRAAGDAVRPFAEVGATWWLEEGLGWSYDELRARILAGPPRA